MRGAVLFESWWAWIVFGLVAFVFAVAVGFATLSLLGTTVGWLRTFLVGLLVFVGSWPFSYFVATEARVVATDGTRHVPRGKDAGSANMRTYWRD